MERLFFELTRVAIGNAVCLSHTPTAKEWQMLYKMAKKQSLVGICFAGVQRLQGQMQYPPEVLYLQWMGMAAKIQQRNEVLNRQCAELQAKLSDCGMKSAVLKGQGVASLYDEPLRALRQSGDIDLWVDAPKENVVELARKTGSKDKATYLHVGAHFFTDTDVELHYRPTYMRNPLHNKRIQEFCDAHKMEWMARNGLMVPSLEFDVVYQLSHIYRHLFGSGIGLRQLMDYYWTLSNSPFHSTGSGQVSGESIIPNLQNLGLYNIAGAVMYVLKVVFGMDEQYLICKPDEKRGKALLESIVERGNFGKMDNEQKEARRSLIGTMAYKVRQWWELLRYYPEETVWAPFKNLILR